MHIHNKLLLVVMVILLFLKGIWATKVAYVISTRQSCRALLLILWQYLAFVSGFPHCVDIYFVYVIFAILFINFFFKYDKILCGICFRVWDGTQSASRWMKMEMWQMNSLKRFYQRHHPVLTTRNRCRGLKWSAVPDPQKSRTRWFPMMGKSKCV